MTYQRFAQLAIQFALAIMLLLVAWFSYHQMMGAMSMPSMPECETFCFIAVKVNVNEFVQSAYYSFVDLANSTRSLFMAIVAAPVVLFYLRYYQPIVHSLVQRLKQYWQRQHWKNGLFCFWTTLYQQGIIAPQIYS